MLAALVVPVITLVILLSSSQLDRATRRLRELPILALLSVLTAVAVVALLVVLVGYQRAIGKVGTIEETRRQGGPRDVAGHLAATSTAVTGVSVRARRTP